MLNHPFERDRGLNQLMDLPDPQNIGKSDARDRLEMRGPGV